MRVKGREYFINYFVAAVLLAACAAPPTPTPQPSPTVTVTAAASPTPADTPTATPLPYPWTDQSAIMSGLCFESVYDAAGRTFVLRSHRDLTHFYDLADNSQLCRRPVERRTFDFDSGAILAGTWTRASGCRARHEVENVRRDDTARTLFIFLRLVTEGDCAYELVQPFWIGLNGLTDYQIQLVVDE